MASPTAHAIATLSELRAKRRLAVEIAGQDVAVFLVGDTIVATNGRCPHEGGPLGEGDLEGPTLTCPWHGWSYDLRTGECEEDPDTELELYDVTIEADRILVRL